MRLIVDFDVERQVSDFKVASSQPLRLGRLVGKLQTVNIFTVLFDPRSGHEYYLSPDPTGPRLCLSSPSVGVSKHFLRFRSAVLDFQFASTAKAV